MDKSATFEYSADRRQVTIRLGSCGRRRRRPPTTNATRRATRFPLRRLPEGDVIRFSFTEWVVVGLYVLVVTSIGSLFYRRRSSAADFFLGGRSMNALPVAISLVAADMSAISYMGLPAWSFQYNLELFWV